MKYKNLKIIFFFFLAYDTYHDDKRQSLIPGLVRVGRNNDFQSDDGKAHRRNMIVYPRVGRNSWEFSPLAHLQTNGQAMDADSLRDDVLLNLEYGALGIEEGANDLQATNDKRPNIRFIPRIGRK